MEIVISLLVIFIGGSFFLIAKQGSVARKLAQVMDDEEDLGPPILSTIPTLGELRHSPNKLNQLKGKIQMVGYIDHADTIQSRHAEYLVHEVYLVDVSGRIHTIDSGQSVTMEDNAIWLAKELDVELVTS